MGKLVVFMLIIAFIIALPLNAYYAYSAVLINEVLANGLNDPDSEWVELFNNESSAVNLTGWRISETSSSNFTLNYVMPANSFIILAVDFSTFNSTYPNVNSSGIKIINITISDFSLADTGGEVRLYNSSGTLADAIAYAQASGKTFENVSIGRYPDGSAGILNLSTLTPGAKNDNRAPRITKWINPPRNNTNISAVANITANITDDTTQVNSTIISFNGTNFSMERSGGLWSFLWNTSPSMQKPYNITLFFNDSYGKSGSETLFNISVNNRPYIVSFSPQNLTPALAENSTLNFGISAFDPDDALLNFSWLVDNVLNGTASSNFSYSPGFGDNGTHIINATLKDPSSNQVSAKWTVAVANLNRAPLLGGIGNMTFQKNVNSSFNITAIDLDSDILAFYGNHSGIAISKFNNSLAAASWKPTNRDLGKNAINFSVTDGFLADSKEIIITVNATGNAAPNITSSPKAYATLHEKYTYDADANDNDNDALEFSVKTNASGLTIDASTGVIAFTPSSVGFFAANVTVTDFTETASQAFNLTVKEGSRLKIADVDVKIDGKKSSNAENNTKISKEAKPGSGIEFRIRVENGFSKSEGTDIEDIQVKVTLEDIDNGDELEEESVKFDLGAESDKAATLKFRLPLNVDEGIFDAIIEAEGEDENGSLYRQHFEIGLEVEKDKHDLRLLRFELSPVKVSCGRAVNVEYKIINTGLEDEENAVLEVKSNELELDFSEKSIAIGSGTGDNVFSQSIKAKISNNIENGIYPITANIYSDDKKLRDTETKEIKVEDCTEAKESSEKEEVLLITPAQQSGATKIIKEPIRLPATKISLAGADRSMQLLVLSSFVFALFFIFTAVILFAKF